MKEIKRKANMNSFIRKALGFYRFQTYHSKSHVQEKPTNMSLTNLLVISEVTIFAHYYKENYHGKNFCFWSSYLRS